MSEPANQVDDTMPEVPPSIGQQLRAAREAKGLSVEQVAAETRISQRYIADIESGRLDVLPGRTYAIGFARTMARVVGLDQNDVAQLVRDELDSTVPEDLRRATFEPGDPARAPSRGLVWFSLLALVLLLVGLFFAARQVFSPAADMPSLVSQQEDEEAAAARAEEEARAAEAAPIAADGEVVFTATGPAWVRFYDAQGNRLMEGEMAEGDSFTIPADAQGPKLITGRPDLLSITIGGREVPKISEELITVTDVPVDGASLLAREAPAPSTAAVAGTATGDQPR